MQKFGKKYFEELLKPVDKDITLNNKQRDAILCDAPHQLIFAGAGTGKTTTIVGKVKYLVDSGKADAKDILVISFTNNAVKEFQKMLGELEGIEGCEVKTFHKLGYTLCNRYGQKPPKIWDGSLMGDELLDTFKELIKDSDFANQVLLFFGSYFGHPFDEMKRDASARYFSSNFTLRSCIEPQMEKDIDRLRADSRTIQYENLRSKEEVDIANFLYLNGISYQYEKEYEFPVVGNHRPYTPDFYIEQGTRKAYIEHFGVREDGSSDRYKGQVLARYLGHIQDKKKCHEKHGTTLITTYSLYLDEEKTYLSELERQLIEHGFVLKRTTPTDVCKKLAEAQVNMQFSRFTDLLTRFITQFKARRFEDPVLKFEEWIGGNCNLRQKLFLQIAKECYLRYEARRKSAGAVDFEDMINNTLQALKTPRKRYKYILIDEYQDVSRNRLDFAKHLSTCTGARVIAVGDDWQTIFGYAGADDMLFRSFMEDFPLAQRCFLPQTYRNSQELINAAGKFIRKDSTRENKRLQSNKHISKPIYIHAYNEFENGSAGRTEVYANAVIQMLRRIVADNPTADWSKQKILLLGRFGFDGKKLEDSGKFVRKALNSSKELIVKEPDLEHLQVDFLTVHKAKGASYEHVVILNAKDDVYGFPSKVMTEPILQLVVKASPEEINLEERRLFYVALTRTKNRVYILTSSKYPSEFVVELMKSSSKYVESNVENLTLYSTEKNRCPICKKPLQFRQSKIRTYTWNHTLQPLSIWECTNDPEACGFMTNNKEGGPLAIRKCDGKGCDGYLIVRHKEDSYFLGCTNYHCPSGSCECTKSVNDVPLEEQLWGDEDDWGYWANEDDFAFDQEENYME